MNLRELLDGSCDPVIGRQLAHALWIGFHSYSFGSHRNHFVLQPRVDLPLDCPPQLLEDPPGHDSRSLVQRVRDRPGDRHTSTFLHRAGEAFLT
jgi:hypothetical protein